MNFEFLKTEIGSMRLLYYIPIFFFVIRNSNFECCIFSLVKFFFVPLFKKKKDFFMCHCTEHLDSNLSSLGREIDRYIDSIIFSNEFDVFQS